MTFRRARDKILDHAVSWKFHLLILSTWLFYHDKLSESGWLMMAASTTGLRELTNLVTLKMGVQPSSPEQMPAAKIEDKTNGTE